MLRAALGGGAALLTGACNARGEARPRATGEEGHLTARPKKATAEPTIGLSSLGLGNERDGLLYVPSGYAPASAWPLVVMLHGATGSAKGGIRPFRELADEKRVVLLAPSSRASTWDIIAERAYGADVRFIDAALTHVFERYTIDPARIYASGFSDGASYALSLGLTNGDLFSRIVAFSPGFMHPATRRGKPQLFVSHGTADEILPIDATSRRLVPALRADGYDVTYKEFTGPHTVPPDVAREALEWLVG
jgi:predicted esterase